MVTERNGVRLTPTSTVQLIISSSNAAERVHCALGNLPMIHLETGRVLAEMEQISARRCRQRTVITSPTSAVKLVQTIILASMVTRYVSCVLDFVLIIMQLSVSKGSSGKTWISLVNWQVTQKTKCRLVTDVASFFFICSCMPLFFSVKYLARYRFCYTTLWREIV